MALDKPFRFMGMCYPGYIWHENDPGTNTTRWSGFAVWSLLDVMRLIGVPDAAIEMVQWHPAKWPDVGGKMCLETSAGAAR